MQDLEARCRELEEQNRELEKHQVSMTVVLDGTGDGIIKCDLEGNIGNVVSSNIIAWFGPFDGRKLWELLFEEDENRQLQLQLELEEIRDDIMPFEVVVAQMQNRFDGWDGQAFEFSVRRVDDGGAGSLIFIIKDITSQLEAERLARASAELQEIVGRILGDTAGFKEFMGEQERLLQGLRMVDPRSPVLARTLHTLKGNAALSGMHQFAHCCHELEDRMVDNGPPDSVEQWADILDSEWHSSVARFQGFLPEESNNIAITPEEHEKFLEFLESRGLPGSEVQTVREWAWQPAEHMLGRLAEKTEHMAERLGKAIDVSVKTGGARLPSDFLSEFWPTLVHVVRNAVDHGVEMPAERARIGKREKGRIDFQLEKSTSGVTLTIADDGRGIDWEVLRNKALDRGFAFLDVEETLFFDGISSKDEASELSGRGVGLADVKAKCEMYQGRVEVSSKTNVGTTFRFVFPPLKPEGGTRS